MPSFLAPIFQAGAGTGLSAAGRAAAGYLFRVVAEQAVIMTVNAGIGIVVEEAERLAEFTTEQLAELAPATLVSFLGINCPGINDDVVMENEEQATRVLNVLAEMDGGDQALASALDELNNEFMFEPETAMAVANISTVAGCALGILRAENDITATRKFPEGSGAPSAIRRCIRSSTDGTRVSREVHEWEYVRQQQWGDVLAEVEQWLRRVVDAGDAAEDLPPDLALPTGVTLELVQAVLDDGIISFAANDYTYGNFVDAARMRRGVEHLRRVRRSVTGARFTSLFRLLGRTRDEVIADINNQTNWGEQFEELLRLRVTPDSGQAGTVSEENAVDF